MTGRGVYVVVLASAFVFFSFFATTAVQRLIDVFDENPHVKSTSIKTFHAPKQNVWAELEDREVVQILEYLHTEDKALNLTKAASATAWDNFIVTVEAIPPPKSKVLPFLDEDAEAPERFARVIVNHGAREDSQICEYSVGPLPVSDSTAVAPLTTGHTNGKHCVRNKLADLGALQTFFQTEMYHLADILADLLGEALDYGQGLYNNIILGGRMLRAGSDGKVLMWTSVSAKTDAWSLMPQGLYIELDVTGRNVSNWHILRWFYAGTLYNSTDAFRAAWETEGFARSPPNLNDGWTDIDFDADAVPGRELPGPIMVQPGGSRLSIDREENYVSWMGYTFYLTSRTANAMTLYDIRFRGERIMYELGLQEALAHYAGDNPMQSGQLWLDSFFGMGLRMFELVPGYDCPAYAEYLDTKFSRMEESWENPRSVCLFEYTADYPLQRHTTDGYVTVAKNNYLVVRSVSTVGNYDYTIEYLFYLDGTIVVQVRASGYIFSAFLVSPPGPDQGDEDEDEYGYRVHDTVSGSLHDHVINFKADLDIAGTSNTLVRVDIAHTDKTYAWDADLTSQPRHTMHLTTSPIPTERGLDWPKNWASQYIVLNNDSRNAWGEKRGYRIAPRTGQAPFLTIRNSSSLERASVWADHHFWVLRARDEEARSSHELNYLDPGGPLVEFGGFVDGEGVVQEDLVIYFNLGAHHIPHSGDIPNTLEHTSATSMMFMPHNFHDRDPSRKSVSGVRINLREPRKEGEKEEDLKVKRAENLSGQKEGKERVEYFGGRYSDALKLSKDQVAPDLNKYLGLPHGLRGVSADGTQSGDEGMVELTFNNSLMGMGIVPSH